MDAENLQADASTTDLDGAAAAADLGDAHSTCAGRGARTMAFTPSREMVLLLQPQSVMLALWRARS